MAALYFLFLAGVLVDALDVGGIEVDSEEDIEKLDEDIWYVLKDKLEGAEANGK